MVSSSTDIPYDPNLNPHELPFSGRSNWRGYQWFWRKENVESVFTFLSAVKQEPTDNNLIVEAVPPLVPKLPDSDKTHLLF